MSVDFAAARDIMVDSQVRTQDVTDLAIQDAMRAFPRESLAPPGKGWIAYADTEVEYAPGRWMLRPRDVAKLLQAISPRAGERALAISAPYAGAIMTLMGLSVTRADARDFAGGLFDVIACEGAVGQTPANWKAALAVGGRLGVVERDGPVGHVRLYFRTADTLASRVVFDCTPPIMTGFEVERGFAL